MVYEELQHRVDSITIFKGNAFTEVGFVEVSSLFPPQLPVVCLRPSEPWHSHLSSTINNIIIGKRLLFESDLRNIFVNFQNL
jgi:hypothetical protein